MKIRYFADIDTVYIELTQNPVVESRDLNEYTVIDLDEHENLVAITVEQASERATIADFSFQQELIGRVPVDV